MAGWQDAPVVGGEGPAPAAVAPQGQAAWMAAPMAGEEPGAAAPKVAQPAAAKTDLESAKESLGVLIKPQAGTVPGTWEYAKGLGREAMLEANPLVNLGAWVIKQVTGQKTEGTLKLGPALAPKEPTVLESLKAGASFMADNPLTATAELAKGLILSPELSALAISRGPQMAARMAELAGAGRKMRAVAATGEAAIEGAAAMGGLSLLQQAAQKEEVNYKEAGAAAAMGAAMVPAIHAAGAAWKGLGKLGTPKDGAPTPTLDRFQETVGAQGELNNPRAPAEVAARPAELPILETAFRNKETGEVTTSGAKHDEAMKAQEKFEPGFIGEDGKFLTRQEALREVEVKSPEALKETPDPEQGLHSTDLGKKGVPLRPAQSEASLLNWKQKWGADPKLRAALGLTAVGAMVGGHLAGDEKIAGAVLGGIAGAGLLRLPSTLSALGKTISPRQAAANAAKIGMVLGGGVYIGSKSDDPVMGAVAGAAILLGRTALKPAARLVTDDMIALRNGNIAAQERITHNLKRDIMSAVPEEGRRAAISDAIDRGDASRLTEVEKKVYTAAKNFNDAIGKEAKDAEIIRGMRENYISYIVEKDPTTTPEQHASLLSRLFEGGDGAGGLSTKSKFGKQGKYETFSELNNAIQGSGLRLKTMDVAEIMEIYSKSMRQAIENKVLVENLKAAKTPEGSPYLTKSDDKGNLPAGYKSMNHPQLRGYGAHPDLVDSLKVVMDNTDPNVVTRGLLGLSMAVKRVQVFGSMFHAKSLMEVYINSMGRDFYSASRGINMEPVNQALKMFREGGLGDTMDLGIRNGLMMKVPHDVSQSIIGDIGKAIDGLVPRLTGKELKIGSAVTDKIDFVNGKMDKLTWDYMHAGVKGALFLKEFETMTARNAEAHARDPKKFPLKSQDQIAREVAKYANDLTGGLDWFQIAADAKTQLGRNLGMFFAGPQGRRFAQILAFAPDWAVSTLRAGFNSFGKSDTGLKGILRPENTTDLYRKYAMRSTLYWITLLNGINLATAGRPIWQNKDPTRIEFDDGTSMQAGKHTFEAVHAVADPARFAYNKLGYTPKMVNDFFSGKEGYGERAPKYNSFAKHAAETALPFTVSAAKQEGLTGPERAKRAVLSGVGFPTYGYTKEQKELRKVSAAEEREKKKRKKEAEKTGGLLK